MPVNILVLIIEELFVPKRLTLLATAEIFTYEKVSTALSFLQVACIRHFTKLPSGIIAIMVSAVYRLLPGYYFRGKPGIKVYWPKGRRLTANTIRVHRASPNKYAQNSATSVSAIYIY